MLKIAVTGQIASGKSTTSRLLAARGGLLIDADEEVHRLMLPGTETYLEIRTHFGDRIINQDGTINRKKLAEVVFNDGNELNFLERLLHPKVANIIIEKTKLAGDQEKKFVVVDLPLLEKSGIRENVDIVLLVEAFLDQQLKRCEAEGMTEAEARLRLENQPNAGILRNDADVILTNNSTLDDLRKSIDELFEKKIEALIYKKNSSNLSV